MRSTENVKINQSWITFVAIRKLRNSLHLIREKVKRDIIMIYNYTQAIRKADTTEINISNQMHKKTRIT